MRWLGLAALAWAGAAPAASVRHEAWGAAPDGEPAELYTIRDGDAELRVTTYGARMVSIRVPDRDGRVADVLVSRAAAADFAGSFAVAGATMGRYAGRIGGARYTLDGAAVALEANSGGNTLHGGARGFHLQRWRAAPVQGGVRLTLVSPDGEAGFPGTLTTTVTYTLARTRGGMEVRIAYAARTTRPTVVNLTNHALFNLSGGAARPVADEELAIAADRSVVTGDGNLPTGALAATAGTPLDFAVPRAIGAALPERGYDATLVLRRRAADEPAATVRDPVSGRTMAVFTTEPAVQLFVPRGRFAEALGAAPGATIAFSLETQHFPDSPNRPEFPSTVLRPGRRFASETRYVFGVR